MPPHLTGVEPGSLWAWLLALSGLSVVHAGYRAWKEERASRVELYDKLEGIRQARPRLVVCGQKWVSLFARNVSVRVRVVSAGDAEPWPVEFVSQWVLAVDPDVASYKGFQQAVDIPANDSPAKFLLLLRHESETDCYAHFFGKLIGTPDGRYAPFRVAPGLHQLRLVFRGDNVEQELVYTLRVPLDARQPLLTGIKNHTDEPEPSRGAEED